MLSQLAAEGGPRRASHSVISRSRVASRSRQSDRIPNGAPSAAKSNVQIGTTFSSPPYSPKCG